MESKLASPYRQSPEFHMARAAHGRRLLLIFLLGVASCASIPAIPAEYQLTPIETSADSTYGYTEGNPIKVGGKVQGQGPANEMEYVSSLRNIDGDQPEFERLGSCCMFKTKFGLQGSGFLDIYQLVFQPHDTIILYLNMYDYEDPKIPLGLYTSNTAPI